MAAGFFGKLWGKVKQGASAIGNGIKKASAFMTGVNAKVLNGLQKIPGVGAIVDKIPLMDKIVPLAGMINNKVNNWATDGKGGLGFG